MCTSFGKRMLARQIGQAVMGVSQLCARVASRWTHDGSSRSYVAVQLRLDVELDVADLGRAAEIVRLEDCCGQCEPVAADEQVVQPAFPGGPVAVVGARLVMRVKHSRPSGTAHRPCPGTCFVAPLPAGVG